MRKSNTARAVEPASDLRQRAARARDAAGRFIRRPDPPPLPADEVDAELLQLGAQLGDAIARARALHEASQQLIEARISATPKRRTCLYFREDDRRLYLRQYLTEPAALDGMEVSADDVAWMRRKPYVREVRRAPRPDDGLPADAHTIVEHHPWPEAQARADEIITAWDAWKAECARVRAAFESDEDEREDRAEAAKVEVEALADRIAEMPAFSAEGLLIKLRAAGHYEDEHDSDYPGGRLLNSLLRDAERETPTPAITSHPDAALVVLGAEFMAAWAAEDTVDDNEAEYLACTGLAEQIARLPATTVAGLGIKALLLARLDSDDSGPRRPVASQGPLASHWNVLRQIQQGAARLAVGEAQPVRACAPARPDLSSLPVSQLARLYSVLVRAWELLASAENSPCFLAADGSGRTDAGDLINWETDRLQRFSSAVAAEISRRQPDDRSDQAERANTLLTHMVLTGGVEEHPEVLSEICAAWGSAR